ncbi:hypothetical protein D3C72_1854060 [compost metagenome]
MARSKPVRACKANIMFSRTDSDKIAPSCLRSSEQKPISWAIASRGTLNWRIFPCMTMLPESALSAPNSKRASSVRPEPSKPARPSNSPWRMWKSMGSRAPLRPSPCASSTVGPKLAAPASCARSSVCSCVSAATPIILLTSARRDSSLHAYSPSRSPLRMTVIRSEMA